jgi:dipeptidyl-peptidase-4
MRGIVDYSWSPDGKKILVPLPDALFWVELAAHNKVKKLVNGAVVDAKVSPKGRYVSYVRAQNLFAVDLQTGRERQLTRDGGGTIHNAEAEFFAQEEMDQSTGYWWAPDDSAIAFKRFDEAPVAIARRVQIHADRTDLVEQRYPYAGAPNVTLGLGLVAPTGGAVRIADLGPDVDIYLPRVDWRPDAKELWYQRQSRDQKHLDLIALRVDAVMELAIQPKPAKSATAAQRTVLSESSATWVNLHDDLRFLKGADAFIWASEKSGSKHLYLHRLDGRLLHPISGGEWGIDKLLAVDEALGRVLVASNKESVPEKQVYALPLSGEGEPLRITHAPGWHEAVFSEDGSLFVDSYSSPETPPRAAWYPHPGQSLALVSQHRIVFGAAAWHRKNRRWRR